MMPPEEKLEHYTVNAQHSEEKQQVSQGLFVLVVLKWLRMTYTIAIYMVKMLRNTMFFSLLKHTWLAGMDD